MSYKKRGRAGWTGKKEAKGKIGRERIYAKKEIKQALTEIEAGEEYRYPHHSPVTPNEKARLESQIEKTEHRLNRYREWSNSGYMWKSWASRAKSQLDKLKNKLKEKFSEKTRNGDEDSSGSR